MPRVRPVAMGECSGKAPGLHRPERMCAQCLWPRILPPRCSVSRRSSRLSADGAASGPSTVSAVRVSLVLYCFCLSETHTTRPNAARGVSQIPATTVTGRCGYMVEPPDWCAPLDPSYRRASISAFCGRPRKQGWSSHRDARLDVLMVGAYVRSRCN